MVYEEKNMKLLWKISLLFLIFSSRLFAAENSVNVYTWSGVIPDFIIQQFEKETGIKVNFSTYDSNETMYAKLRASKNAGYDIIEPSSYYIDRMRKQNMLEPLDKSKLIYYKNLNSDFLNQAYDPQSQFSIPFIWGITGIFTNETAFPKNSIHRWSDLWDPKYKDQLMMLNDSREVFSIALRVLGYSTNDNNPEHIKQAYLKLKELMPNIKLFNSDAVISIFIDGDAMIGMAWNGDLFKAKKENPKLTFTYPADGFVIWVDNFAIPKNAPHRENAYKFLNFLMRADVAKAIALDNNYPTANKAAQKLLPADIRNNPIVYPSHAILKQGEFQTDLGDQALTIYEKYWEELKMGA
jgi:spermidine/putrescine transport system substrate-binding protein